jgi:NADH dehydrogenase
MPLKRKLRVVIIGGGFAGIAAAKRLAETDVDLFVIDRRNYHLFQPLLYQVATASLSPADIASPIRKILRSQTNTQVIMGEVSGIDVATRSVKLASTDITYDYLIVASGATHSYFGHDEWSHEAPGLKTIEDATEIRRRFLLAFESAELESDPEARKALLTFVVVGGGPTGVELAGAMAEIARKSIPMDFRSIDTAMARVILIEGNERLLTSYPPESSSAALRQLEKLGVEVMLGKRVTAIDSLGVMAGAERIDARNILWAAGVKASPLGRMLGVPTDNAGCVLVQADLSIPDHPEVFVCGDLAHVENQETKKRVPGVCPAALQMGDFVGRIIQEEARAYLTDSTSPLRQAFVYVNKGDLATIGRNCAVAVIAGRQFSGWTAWLLWAGVHIYFLIEFRNRLTVALSWIFSYLFFDRGARLITGDGMLEVTKPRDPDNEIVGPDGVPRVV